MWVILHAMELIYLALFILSAAALISVVMMINEDRNERRK